MSHSITRRGLLLATTAAALFGAGGTLLAAESQGSASEGNVHCMGINACKGQTACASANNSCKGQNSCRGQGWLPTKTKAECTEKGGTVAE
jgi:uncharacterized membrane protein